MERFEVVVVGGSFAGLNFANCAAKKGLKVLVLDNNKRIGSNVRTTGIFIKRLLEEFKIPKRFISNGVKEVSVFSPSRKKGFVKNSTLERKDDMEDHNTGISTNRLYARHNI